MRKGEELKALHYANAATTRNYIPHVILFPIKTVLKAVITLLVNAIITYFFKGKILKCYKEIIIVVL